MLPLPLALAPLAGKSSHVFRLSANSTQRGAWQDGTGRPHPATAIFGHPNEFPWVSSSSTALSGCGGSPLKVTTKGALLSKARHGEPSIRDGIKRSFANGNLPSACLFGRHTNSRGSGMPRDATACALSSGKHTVRDFPIEGALCGWDGMDWGVEHGGKHHCNERCADVAEQLHKVTLPCKLHMPSVNVWACESISERSFRKWGTGF